MYAAFPSARMSIEKVKKKKNSIYNVKGRQSAVNICARTLAVRVTLFICHAAATRRDGIPNRLGVHGTRIIYDICTHVVVTAVRGLDGFAGDI